MKACKPSGSLAVTTTMRLKQILLNLTSGNEATESSRLAPVTFQPQCWSALSVLAGTRSDSWCLVERSGFGVRCC
jgi:hypothetical protein